MSIRSNFLNIKIVYVSKLYYIFKVCLSILFEKNYNYLIYKQLQIDNNLYLHD